MRLACPPGAGDARQPVLKGRGIKINPDRSFIIKPMDDKDKTMERLIEENNQYKKRIAELGELLSKQQKTETELRKLSLSDDLTDLYNRRGFFTLMEQQLKMAKRLKTPILLLYADIDNLKKINDTFGHNEGAKAIIDAANILKSTHRESDIMARIGGDEFVVLPVGATEDNAEIIKARLQKNIDAHNSKNNRRYKISISVGIKEFDPLSSHSLEDMLHQADILMYEDKKSKKF